jgi:hypothetical protein
MGFCVSTERTYVRWQVFSAIIRNANNYIDNECGVWTPGQRAVLATFIADLINDFRTSTFNGLVVPPAGDMWQNSLPLQEVYNRIRDAVPKGNYLGGDHGVYWYIFNPFNPQPNLPTTDLVPIARFFTAVALFWGEYDTPITAVNYLIQTDFVNYAFSDGNIPPTFDYPLIREFLAALARVSFVQRPLTIPGNQIIIALTPFLLESGNIVELNYTRDNPQGIRCGVISGDGGFTLVNGGVYLTVAECGNDNMVNVRPVLDDDLTTSILLTRVGRPRKAVKRSREQLCNMERARFGCRPCNNCQTGGCNGCGVKGEDIDIDDLDIQDEEDYTDEKGGRNTRRQNGVQVELDIKRDRARTRTTRTRRTRPCQQASVADVDASDVSDDDVSIADVSDASDASIDCTCEYTGTCDTCRGDGRQRPGYFFANDFPGSNRINKRDRADAMIDSPFTIFGGRCRPYTIFEYLQKILDRVDTLVNTRGAADSC